MYSFYRLCAIFVAFSTFLSCSTQKKETITTEVLVIGGGASGTMAAIQAARLGARVVVVEETVWLGGMLTSAGVSAIDGNHMLAGGLWGEFRQKLYDHYGGPVAVETGWVSNTLFEPHIGQKFLRQMVNAEPNIQVIHGYWSTGAMLEGNRITGGIFQNEKGTQLEITATVVIQAEEYGDFLKYAGIPYRFGFESRSNYGDSPAPDEAWPHIQDLTYVVLLKEYGIGSNKTIPKPAGYDPALFDCTCKQLCSDPDRNVVDCGPESGKDLYMFNYGKLPNDYFMINWPINGNDYYIPILEMTRAEREKELRKAKSFTLKWLYFVQNEGGYVNMGIAEDIFPTKDNFPMIPYIRESRRVKGHVSLTMNDLKDPYQAPSGSLYKTAVAVGDYPLDLHHQRKPAGLHTNVTTESMPKIPSYSVPYGSMLPEGYRGIIVAEKSISVTHIVNGATRLQPVVMLLGQAAGAAAALSIIHSSDPSKLDIRILQQTLLDADVWLMPFADTHPSEDDFQSIQRVALTGWMRGTGQPSAWANRTWFYPDSVFTRLDLNSTARYIKETGWEFGLGLQTKDNNVLTRAQLVHAVWELAGKPTVSGNTPSFTDVSDNHPNRTAINWFTRIKANPSWILNSQFFPNDPVNRREAAIALDKALNPFQTVTVKLQP